MVSEWFCVHNTFRSVQVIMLHFHRYYKWCGKDKLLLMMGQKGRWQFSWYNNSRVDRILSLQTVINHNVTLPIDPLPLLLFQRISVIRSDNELSGCLKFEVAYYPEPHFSMKTKSTFFFNSFSLIDFLLI